MSEILNGCVRNVLLRELTTWRVGGHPQYFTEVQGDPEIFFSELDALDLPHWILGKGSNVLVRDGDFPGLVVSTRNSLKGLERQGDLVIAEAGVSLPALSKFVAREGFSGFEFLVGIPGSVGGGLAMNAGLTVFRPREISDMLAWVDVYVPGQGLLRLSPDECGFTYRGSKILHEQWYLVRAAFKLTGEDDPKEIRQRSIEHHRERKSKQPLAMPTVGSTFKSKVAGKSAGYWIEQAGLKGRSVGGARVSEMHANWIENFNQATSQDILNLVELVESEVEEQHGVRLEREFQLIGF